VTQHTTTPAETTVDVVVVGGGNAGFCAAHAASDAGASVLLLERAPEDEAGGNSFYTAGAFRVVHAGAGALARVCDDETTTARLAETDLAPYPAAEFHADMRRITDGRCDEEMTSWLVEDSADLPVWLHEHGIRWRLMYERQSYQVEDRWVFSGGLALGTVGGGKGLVEQHTEHARGRRVEIRYDSRVTGLLTDDGRVTGVEVESTTGSATAIRAGSVVITAGGFEADPDLRAQHLGDQWRHALVRGNPLNTGDLLGAALEVGAATRGDFASCHSVAWDAGAPANGGERTLTNQLTRQSYPLGICVNREGRRFLDEGADFRNYTYAKYGRRILEQPGGVAFQLFDATTRPMLRHEEYDSEPISMARADDLDELAGELGIDAEGLRRTVDEFNAAIEDKPFDPAVKDGRRADVTPPKSNWSMALESPPYYGYAVACGITFTFGGLAVDEHARVLDDAGEPLPGLYAAGEIVGGLFSGNYPGGSGLTAGAVFGRRAGRHAGSTSVR
jgi:tricarballylate dehydrogenase